MIRLVFNFRNSTSAEQLAFCAAFQMNTLLDHLKQLGHQFDLEVFPRRMELAPELPTVSVTLDLVDAKRSEIEQFRRCKVVQAAFRTIKCYEDVEISVRDWSFVNGRYDRIPVVQHRMFRSGTSGKVLRSDLEFARSA